MSSDRIGKFRERASRSRTPYSRPKGIIRRVTDSVSGLLSSSWIPGFLRTDEQEELAEQNHQQQPQAGPSGYNPARPNAQQNSPTRSFAAIYPEEAGDNDVSSNAVYRESAGANSSSTRHHSIAGTAGVAAAQETANFDGINTSIIFPESSYREKHKDELSTPQQQFSTAHSSHGAAQSQYSAVPTPLQYSGGSHQYSGGASTSQHQFLGASTSSQQYSGASSLQHQYSGVSTSSHRQQTSLLHDVHDSLNELEQHKDDSVTTRHVASQFTPGSNSSSNRLHDAVSTPSSRLSSAQSSSKRPRFSLAAYSAAATPVGNKSVLSDGSFRSSPFYPGRTIYGGAAAYRRTPTPVTPNRSATASPRIGGGGNDAGLSDAAQRILTCLNAMSTPLTDAKRIPTPSASPYVSYLDSPYTAAFHKHKPNRPPIASLNTPAKVGIQSNLSEYALPSRGSTSNTSNQHQSSSSKADHSFLDPAASSSNSGTQQPSIFSVAAASASRSTGNTAASIGTTTAAAQSVGGSSSASSSSTSINPLLQPSTPIVLSTSSATRLPTVSEVDTNNEAASVGSTSMFSFGGGSSSSDCTGGGGKIKTTKLHSQNRQSRSNLESSGWDVVSAPALPNATLPKLTFAAPISLPKYGAKQISSSTQVNTSSVESQSSTSLTRSQSKSNNQVSETAPLDAFKFSVPEVLQKGTEISNEGTTMPQFRFSAPSSVMSGDPSTNDFVVPNSSFVPKVKSTSPVKKSVNVDSNRELITKPGSLLEFLNKTSDSTNSNNNKDIKNSCKYKESDTVITGWGDKFKTATGSWECTVCLVRNKAEDSKCLSCDTSKPGQSSSDSGASNNNNNNLSTVKTSTSSGFGDFFKKTGKEWDCDTCLLRNKSDADSCIACQAPKPGAKSSASSQLSSSGSFSFGVPPSDNSSSISFGVPSSSVASSGTSTASTNSGFSFGSKSVSSSCNFNFGVTSSSSSTTSSITTAIGSSKDSVEANLEKSNQNSSFGAAFKKAIGDWECGTCLVNNKSSAMKCVACEAAKAEPKDSVPASVPNNNNNNNKIENKPASQGFGDQFKKAAGDWECETCLVSNKSSNVKCLACKSPKPGTTSNTKALTGSYKFGSVDQSSESGFKFVVSNCTSGSAGAQFAATSSANLSSAFGFGAKPSSKESPKAKFSFGIQPSVTSNGSHTFGSVVTTNATSTEPSLSASSPYTVGFSFNAPTSQSPVLKTKPVEKTPSKTLELQKGSVLDFLSNTSEKQKNSPEKSSTKTISFGGNSLNKSSESSSSTVPPYSFVSSNSPSKSTFGSNSTDLNIKTPNLFQNSIAASPNDKAETKTSNKRSLTEDYESPSKRSNSTFGKNNGISDNGGQFTFGKAVSSGESTASMFQFGDKVATKPASVFGGGATPMFGAQNTSFTNNNNNTINDTKKPVGGAAAAATPIFAFGQPSEKKPNASFDFGQPAASAPSFNFGATAPNFQFAQSNASSGGAAAAAAPSNNGSIFQFGSAPAPASAVTPSFGGAPANLFSQTPSATPPGRVVKRAIRRTKK